MKDDTSKKDDAVIINELDYKCNVCGQVFSGHAIKFKKVSYHIVITGIDPDELITQCPHCGVIAFFGLKEIHDGSLENAV